jgi:hypothetical protein
MADSEIIFSVEESPEGAYEARALGYSIYTQADTLEELKGMAQDAVRCHFDEEVRPRVIRLHLVKDEVIPARSFRETSLGQNWPLFSVA